MTGALMGALQTDRLTLRTWRLDDAPAALEIYGHEDAARWLSPAMDRVDDLATMQSLLARWTTDAGGLTPPAGRWAIERTEDQVVVGGAVLLPLPPGNEDLGLGWHLIPGATGNDYADEIMFALASWAFEHEVDELFAVVSPENEHDTAKVRQNGMHWVGETTKYFGQKLHVFRLRQADLDRGAPSAHQPPKHD
jgi:RimJ/RimL family protein N-acetyltransferase